MGEQRKQMVFLLVIVTVCIRNVVSQSPPRIVGIKHTLITIKAGTEARLICPVEKIEGQLNSFNWLKDEHPITHTWERFRFAKEGSVLKIQQVVVEDSGKYTCDAVNGFGHDELYITLIVTGSDSRVNKNQLSTSSSGFKPRFDNLKKMSHYPKIRPIGSTVRLKCKASGSPQPKIIWRRGDEVIQESQTQNNHKMHYSLTIKRAQPDHNGEYTCTVYNKHGSINFTYVLKITKQASKEPIMVPPHPTNLTVMFGKTASFQCRVTSHVPPKMKWLKRLNPDQHPKPNLTIPLDGHHLIMLKSDDAKKVGKNSYLSKLVIHRVTYIDAGMYICLCIGADTVSKSAFLTVKPHKGLVPHGPHSIDDETSSSLILEITIPTIALLIIISLIVYIYLHRRKRCTDGMKQSTNSSTTSQNVQRVPLPLPEKDVQHLNGQPVHAYQPPREKFSTMVYSKPCNSTDIYSDISSVSQSRYSPHGQSSNSHSNAYTHLMQPSPYQQQQQQVHYNF